jgi:hypothetical protein
MNPSDINEYDTALNMYRYLTNQRGMSDADAQAYIRQNLSNVNRAAVSSNTMANAAPEANLRAAAQAQREPVANVPPQPAAEPPAPPVDKYAGMTPAEAGAAKAQDLATYQFWKNFQGAPTTPRDERRPSFQTMSGLAARAQAIDPQKAAEAQRLIDVNQRKIQDRDFNTFGRQVDGPSAATNSMDYPGDISSAAPPAGSPAPVYDYDARSAPQDVEGWGRKVAGPSAATNSMDAPANAVGFAKQVLASTKNPDRTAVTAIPAMPVRRPDAIGQLPGAQPAQQESLLSRIFSAPKDPYAGMSSRQLMDVANRDPDNAAAFFRADKALQKEQPDMFKPQAEKRGGSVGGGKDAALHKALEIIHHMITRGR